LCSLGELEKAEKDCPDPWNLMRIIPMKGSLKFIVYTLILPVSLSLRQNCTMKIISSHLDRITINFTARDFI